MAGDLHCHTKISDGTLGIDELISLAKRRNISVLSVTDHDATAGATRAVIVGKRRQIQVIHGVELSTRDASRGLKIHLLCYLCDNPDRLEGLCRRTSEGRRRAAMEMIQKVMRYYPVTPDLIARCAAGSTNIYKQHIMHALMETGYADAIYGEVYQKLFAPGQGAALVEPEYPDPREVLELIHSAGGVAVMAHPALYGAQQALEELTALGLDGVEVWHPSHTEENVAQLSAFARDHQLLMTGGSDFHGLYAPSRPLGSATIPDEHVQALLTYKARLKKQRA